MKDNEDKNIFSKLCLCNAWEIGMSHFKSMKQSPDLSIYLSVHMCLYIYMYVLYILIYTFFLFYSFLKWFTLTLIWFPKTSLGNASLPIDGEWMNFSTKKPGITVTEHRMAEAGSSPNRKASWIIKCKSGFIKKKKRGENLIKLEGKKDNHICFLSKEKEW